jgi:hypothetical protein
MATPDEIRESELGNKAKSIDCCLRRSPATDVWAADYGCFLVYETLCNYYHTVRTTSTGLAVDEPVHDWDSHAASALKVIAEAEMAGMLSSAGSTASIQRQPVMVRTRLSRQRFPRLGAGHPGPLFRQAETEGDFIS